MDTPILITSIMVVPIIILTSGAIGMMTGSLFDKGHRYEGRWLGDMPSTLGLLVGVAIGVYISKNNFL